MLIPLLTVLLTLVSCRDVDKIEHVVIFMQENRAFDHYYGTLKGVRGFNDRVALPVNGRSSFYQPITAGNNETYMLPFRVNSWFTNAMCMDAPCMSYVCDMGIWNKGKHDAWNTARDGGMGMSYFTRSDLPYYYTLYDNFVAGDQYHQSTFTETNPNRLHLFSGSNGLSVNGGAQTFLDNTEPNPGHAWPTLAEILQEADVSWKVYQELDNFDDNGFAWFANFQASKAGDVLYDQGMKRSVSMLADFTNDVSSGKLPQVSILIAPTIRSEHANNHPSIGEAYSANILKVLQDNPDIYATTAFILNYDEGGQWYDHGNAPTPPINGKGKSTVSTDGEINTKFIIPDPIGNPIGLGFRVPLLIISPWTRGNIVVSEIFDHTSVLKFLEIRFNITIPNISPWRRAVTGNLMSAFDFANPDYTWPALPSTWAAGNLGLSYLECLILPKPKIPTVQTFPVQEKGTRISRALPYEFVVSDSYSFNTNTFTLNINNTGTGGSPFSLFDLINNQETPRQYTVEGGKNLQDSFVLSTSAAQGYDLLLLGPNGFARKFVSNSTTSDLGFTSFLSYNPSLNSVSVNVASDNVKSHTFTLVDNAYATIYDSSFSTTLSQGAQKSFTVSTIQSGNWYDLTLFESTGLFSRRYLGRMETGKDTISDPAMGSGVPDIYSSPSFHADLPASLIEKVGRKSPLNNKDKHKDHIVRSPYGEEF